MRKTSCKRRKKTVCEVEMNMALERSGDSFDKLLLWFKKESTIAMRKPKSRFTGLLDIYNILNAGFPIYMIVFEMLLRSFSSVDTSSFIGPTLAAGGLGLILGILQPKAVREHYANDKSEQPMQHVPRNPRDEKLIVLAWMSILVELLIWYWVCASSIKNGNQFYFPGMLGGASNYVLSLILLHKKNNISHGEND
jgi:hypothetical protein